MVDGFDRIIRHIGIWVIQLSINKIRASINKKLSINRDRLNEKQKYTWVLSRCVRFDSNGQKYIRKTANYSKEEVL
jgi:hypothetical protein